MAADFIIAYGAKLEACTQILEMPEWKGRTENACRECTRTTTRQKLQNVTAAKMTMMISNMFICVCNGKFGHAVHLPGGGCSLPRTAVAVAGAGGGLVRVDVAAALLRCAGKTVRACGAAGARCRARRP